MSKEVCTCPIRPGMSKDQLLDEIIRPRKMCTDQEGQRWVCPTLDRELRRATTEQGWRKYQAKKLKKEGYTEEQIAEMKPRRKRGQAMDIETGGLELAL